MIKLFLSRFSVFNSIKRYYADSPQYEKKNKIGLPRFPSITLGLIFFFMIIKLPSFATVSFIVNAVPLVIIVLLDYRWWASFVFKASIKSYPLNWLFALIFIGIILSSYTSLNPARSYYEIFKSLTIIWLVIGAYEILSQVDYRRWLPWFINMFTVASIWVIMYSIKIQVAAVFDTSKMMSVLYLGWVTVCFLPIFIYCFQSNIKRIQVVFIVFCAIYISIIFENRTTVVGMATVIVTYLAIYNNRYGWKIYPIIACVVLVAFTTATYLYSVKYNAHVNVLGILNLPTWIVDPHRQAIWQFSLNAIPSTPFFGFGIDSLTLLDGAMEEVPWLIGAYKWFHAYFINNSPHNIFLQWLLELGWLNFLFIIFIYILLAIKLIMEKHKVKKLELLLHAGYFAIASINTSYWDTFWFIAYFSCIAVIRGLANSVDLYGGNNKKKHNTSSM